MTGVLPVVGNPPPQGRSAMVAQDGHARVWYVSYGFGAHASVVRMMQGPLFFSFRRARLNLVDLAGSERQKATGVVGKQLKEGCHINKSLSALGCTRAAAFWEPRFFHLGAA